MKRKRLFDTGNIKKAKVREWDDRECHSFKGTFPASRERYFLTPHQIFVTRPYKRGITII